MIIEGVEMQEDQNDKFFDPNLQLQKKIIEFGGYLIDITPYERVGEYAAGLIYEILLDQQRQILNTEADDRYEYFIGPINQSSIKITHNEIQKILIALELIDIKDNPQSILWIGPDTLNITGVSRQNLEESLYLKDILTDSFEAYQRNYPYELALKESSYFHGMNANLSLNNQLKEIWLTPTLDSFQEFRDIHDFDEYGFACLKGDRFNFVIKKTYAIIGRTAPAGNVSWEVDLDLQGNPKVSRQHALIVFNFENLAYELICLSRKNSILVNHRKVAADDNPFPLHHEAIIEIANEKFYFLLPHK